MSIKIKTINDYNKYFDCVLERANDHANSIIKVTYYLSSLVLRFMDKDSIIEVREQSGEMKNILWFIMYDKRYAIRYEHDNNTIELRERKVNGPIIGIFDKTTSFDTIYNLFIKLSNKKY